MSRHRLAVAFERACPRFAAWCDDAKNGLSRKEFVDQFEAAWRSQLDLSLPLVGAHEVDQPITCTVKPAATFYRMNFELSPMRVFGPRLDLRLKVSCRFEEDAEAVCAVVATIADVGVGRPAVFYVGSLSAEVVEPLGSLTTSNF